MRTKMYQAAVVMLAIVAVGCGLILQSLAARVTALEARPTVACDYCR